MSKDKYPSILSSQMEAIEFIILQNLCRNARSFENWGIYNNSLHLARKYARIFVRGYCLFRVANSFPRATLLGTDNLQGQISEHIFAPNGGYCLYYPSNLLRNARSFENWGISSELRFNLSFSIRFYSITVLLTSAKIQIN